MSIDYVIGKDFSQQHAISSKFGGSQKLYMDLWLCGGWHT